MQGQPTTPPTDAQPPGETIRSGAACIQCGYALDGLHRGGVCPECGTAIARSFGGDSLADSPRGRLRSIAAGILCVQLAAALGASLTLLVSIGLLVGMVSALLDRLLRGGGPSAGPIGALLTVGLVLMAALAIISCVGSMLFTVADSRGVETEESTRDRIIVRSIALAQCGTNLFVLGLPVIGKTLTDSLANLLLYAIVVSLLLQCVQVIAATSRARWLFSRVPSPRGVESAGTQIVLVPVLMILGSIVLIGPLVGMVMHFSLLSRLRYELESVLDRRDVPSADRAPRFAPTPRPDSEPPLLQDRTL